MKKRFSIPLSLLMCGFGPTAFASSFSLKLLNVAATGMGVFHDTGSMYSLIGSWNPEISFSPYSLGLHLGYTRFLNESNENFSAMEGQLGLGYDITSRWRVSLSGGAMLWLLPSPAEKETYTEASSQLSYFLNGFSSFGVPYIFAGYEFVTGKERNLNIVKLGIGFVFNGNGDQLKDIRVSEPPTYVY